MRRILIIDDDEDFSDYLCRCLVIFGFQTARAGNGPTGVKLTKTFHPHIILLDCILKSGFSSRDVLKTLKLDDTTHGIPVVMISGIKESPDDAEAARRSGAEIFLTKSEITNDPHALLRHLKCLLAGPTSRFPRTILLIDDDAAFREAARGAATELCCDLRVARGGDEGMRMATEFRPSLIILNLRLPDFNGFILAQLLRDGGKTRGVPMIVTADGPDAKELLGCASTLQARAFLKNPAAYPELRSEIAVAMASV
jgi:DNA-binding response OmpR family regulator